MKFIQLLKEPFESSSNKTPQYLYFHRTFKREFTKVLTELGATSIKISKPNHFDVSGFFEIKGIFWFRIENLRWDKTFLIRTAKDFNDYTGGPNHFLNIQDEKTFKDELRRFVLCS